MSPSRVSKNQLVVPRFRSRIIRPTLLVISTAVIISGLEITSFETFAATLGLYSAGLLNSFGTLNSWRQQFMERRVTRLNTESIWIESIDSILILILRSCRVAFVTAFFGIILKYFLPIIDQYISAGQHCLLNRVIAGVFMVSMSYLCISLLIIVSSLQRFFLWNKKQELLDADAEILKDELL